MFYRQHSTLKALYLSINEIPEKILNDNKY